MKTYPKMNEEIKSLLKMRNDNVSLYALARISELEEALHKEIDKLKRELVLKNKMFELSRKGIEEYGTCVPDCNVTSRQCGIKCKKQWDNFYEMMKKEAEKAIAEQSDK